MSRFRRNTASCSTCKVSEASKLIYVDSDVTSFLPVDANREKEKKERLAHVFETAKRFEDVAG